MSAVRAISTVFDVLTVLILVDVVASWIPALRESELIGQLQRLTDPVLEPFRRLIPPQTLGIDVSPIAAIFALRFLERLVISAIAG